MGKYFLLALILFYTLRVVAQQPANPFVFTHVLKTGNAQEKHIKSLYQDSHGFIWMASRKGICRYDGLTFKYYNTIGKGGISDWIITCITEDKNGNIWFGTENGLNKLNPFTEKIIQYHSGAGAGTIPFNWCNYLYTDKKKNLWLSTEKGLALYHEQADSFSNFPIKLFGKEERINPSISKIIEDETGNLWMATSYGIKTFNTASKTFTSYHKEETNSANPDNIFYALHIDHFNNIWAGTYEGRIFRFNKQNKEFERINAAKSPSLPYVINDIREIKSGSHYYLLIAANNGLFYTANDQNEPGSHSFTPIAPGTINTVYTDQQQNTWLGSTSGLYKMNNHSFAFTWLSLPPGFAQVPIFHIIPDHRGNSTDFFLSTQKGWFRYHANTASLTAHSIPASNGKILENINNWLADENGYWFTSVTGFGYYNVTQNRLTDLSALIFKASGQYTTGFIIQVASGKYWITMRRSGILEYDAATNHTTLLFAEKNNSAHTYGNSIFDMQLHTDGYVYFTCNKKLYKVNPRNYSFRTYSTETNTDNVTDVKKDLLKILVSADNKILVSSELKLYLLKEEKLTGYYPQNGFSQYPISKITIAPDSSYWILSEQAAYKTDPLLGRWQPMHSLLGWNDSTLIVEINTQATDKILFASVGSLGVLNNQLFSQPHQPPPLIINRVQYGINRKYLLNAFTNFIKTNYKDGIEIELSPVDYTEKNKLLYMLKGWDDEWKELGTLPTIRYEQLPPGSYTFMAKAITTSGVEGASTLLHINIIPPFYRTWWFISLMILTAGAAGLSLYRYKLRKAIELEKIRTRIATDLHDDIGATLSSISMYSESLKGQVKEKLPHLEPVLTKMGENSREMVTGMSDIVWAINPDNDGGEKLQQRMENYATDMCAIKNITLHFEANEKVKQLVLPLEKRKNIYLIFKEALNNAVKYSNAKNIHVKMNHRQKELQIQISDDGKGFDKNKVKKGNGLNNMELRANEMKARLQLTSQPDEGTMINLQVGI